MRNLDRWSLVLLALFVGGNFSPLLSSLSCLDGSNGAGEDCYQSFDEVSLELGMFAEPIEGLARKSAAGAERLNLSEATPEPKKKLTLQILEKAVDMQENIRKSPIGYLTKYGYVKGVLRAMTSCEGSEDIVQSDEIYASMVTFLHSQKTDESEVWMKMNSTRCSVPDITFDEDGNLDEHSAEIVLQALEGTDNLRERVGELRETVNEKRRRRRAAENSKTTLDLNEKSEYSYKLFGKVPGNPFAADSVDLAFESWGNAIGSAVTFTKTDRNNADVELKLVEDAHDDYEFTGDELAHAPFPDSEYHGNVHYRRNRDWSNSDHFTYISVHELGHYLGLKHSSIDGSVMQAIFDSEIVPDDYSGALHPSDVTTVKLLYANAGQSNCPDDWHGFEGICYRTHSISTRVTWDEAQEECMSIGANLTTVRSGPLNEYMLSTVANGRSPYWIGRKSSESGWVNNESFDWYPAINTRRQMNPSTTRCLRTIAYSGQAKWEYVNCNSKKSKLEHFVCQKNEDDFEPDATSPPTEKPLTTKESKVEPTIIPCQNYIKGAIRRGNFLYIFGNSKYYKYFYTNSRPTLQLGYPKDVAESFEGIPNSFTAVVTNPYNRDMVYFIDDQDVYEWEVTGKRSSIEDGKLKKRGKSGTKPKKLDRLFKTDNVIRGATMFDRNSIMLFARAEVGRWHREVVGSKMISKYEEVEKWDYLDTMGSQPIDAVAPSHFDKFIMFIRNDEYFLVRKSDGKIPRKFIRNLSSDFDKLEICDVIAPFITDYPEGIDPDDALLEEDQ